MDFSKRDKLSIIILAALLAASAVILAMPVYAIAYKIIVAGNMVFSTLHTVSSIKKRQ